MIVDPIVAGNRMRASGVSIDLVVPEDLHYFRGHFPGMPVVPGVVQIKWAIALARHYLRADLLFGGMEALKFQQVLLPGARVILDLDYDVDAGKLKFTFGSGPARYSSGRLILRPMA